MSRLIERADKDPKGPKAILLCTHAAAIIALGRVLTGHMPDDIGEEDFQCYTCGLSKYVRRSGDQQTKDIKETAKWSPQQPDVIPDLRWQNGNGVRGGWDCELNSDCSFLENGEERGW